MEKILCCAILRNIPPKTVEWFDGIDHRSKYPPVLCKRHGDGMWLKKQLYGEDTTQSQQGFLTSKYRWVNREEAFRIAKNAGQLKAINQIDGEPIDYTNETLLYSEYVW